MGLRLNWIKKIGCLCALVGLMGCSYVPEKVQLSYEPMLLSRPLAENRGHKIGVVVVDHRRGGKEVSHKKGDHGVELASIMLKGDLANEIEEAMRAELDQLGYLVSRGSTMVEIEIHKFYNDFKQGLWTSRGLSELFLSVHVSEANGNLLFSKNVIGLGEVGGVWVHSGKNAKIALDRALTDAVHQLMRDPSFLKALKPPRSL